MQILQLPLGIHEGVAQRKINILMPGAVDLATVGVNVRARYGQIDLDQVGGCAVARAARAFDRHASLQDPLVEPMQSRPQFPRAILDGAGMVQMAECDVDG
jgi:hypothetical protein